MRAGFPGCRAFVAPAAPAARAEAACAHPSRSKAGDLHLGDRPLSAASCLLTLTQPDGTFPEEATTWKA